MILVLAKKVTKLRLPNVENIIDEAINSVLKKYQKCSLKELIIYL